MLSVWKFRKKHQVHGTKNGYLWSKSLQASSLGCSAGGAGNERRACSYVSGIWIPPLISLWLPINWTVRFPPIRAKQKWVQRSTNIEKHVPRVLTSLLMSSPPISILHQLFWRRYSNSRDVVASSPFLFCHAYRAPKRACLPPKAVIDVTMSLQWSYPNSKCCRVGLQYLTTIKCGRLPKSITSLMCFPANQ